MLDTLLASVPSDSLSWLSLVNSRKEPGDAHGLFVYLGPSAVRASHRQQGIGVTQESQDVVDQDGTTFSMRALTEVWLSSAPDDRQYDGATLTFQLGTVELGKFASLDCAVLSTQGTLHHDMSAYDLVMRRYFSGHMVDMDVSISYDYGAVMNGVATYFLRRLQAVRLGHEPAHDKGLRFETVKTFMDDALLLYRDVFVGKGRVAARSSALTVLACEKMWRSTRDPFYVEFPLQQLLPLQHKQTRSCCLDTEAASMMAFTSLFRMAPPQVRRVLLMELSVSLNWLEADPSMPLLPDTHCSGPSGLRVRSDSDSARTHWWNFKCGVVLRAIRRIRSLGSDVGAVHAGDVMDTTETLSHTSEQEEVKVLALDLLSMPGLRSKLDAAELVALRYIYRSTRQALPLGKPSSGSKPARQLREITACVWSQETNSETQAWTTLGLLDTVSL